MPLYFRERRVLSYAGSRDYGIWWVRVCGYGLALHAHWNEPLFSERYGHKRRLIGAFGWRVLWIERDHGYAKVQVR